MLEPAFRQQRIDTRCPLLFGSPSLPFVGPLPRQLCTRLTREELEETVFRECRNLPIQIHLPITERFAQRRFLCTFQNFFVRNSRHVRTRDSKNTSQALSVEAVYSCSVRLQRPDSLQIIQQLGQDSCLVQLDFAIAADISVRPTTRQSFKHRFGFTDSPGDFRFC